MDLRKVLFIGGSGKLAAVQVRGRDIATRLGCDFMLAPANVASIPDKYSVFVCVKMGLLAQALPQLARRGQVVWDIVDEFPPRENIALYLTSTALAQHLFGDHGRVECIPHHHCNFAGTPNPPANRQPAWIGSRHWRPALRGFKYDLHFTDGKSREDVAAAFRQTGIGLNFRGTTALRKNILPYLHMTSPAERRQKAKNLFDFHLAINSGIKLINCLGFGLPSVSADEPAYHEFGQGCTIFSSIKDSAKWVRALQNDDKLYLGLRKKCLRQAKPFHVDVIAEQYKQLLLSL